MIEAIIAVGAFTGAGIVGWGIGTWIRHRHNLG
jgi:hypothetical protein